MAITDPRDISGLVAWFSAEAQTGYTDNQSMTGITDFSGAGNHSTGVTGTPKWRSTAGSGGGPCFEFVTSAGVTQFSLPNLMSGASAGEVMCTIQIANGGNNNHHFEFGTGGSRFYTFTNSLIYDDFGSTTRKDAISPGVGLTSWHRLNVWSAANDWNLSTNEVSRHSTATNTVGWTSTPKLGPSPNGNGTTRYGCVVLFNRKLTTGERSDLATWLAANPSGGTTTSPNATVAAPASTSAAAAGVPTLSAVRQATVAAVAAVATAACLVPAVTGTANVASPASTATAAALVPSVSTATGGAVSAVTATATGTMHAAAVTGAAVVNATTSTASAAASAPSVSATRSVTVAAVTATATGVARVPAVHVIAPQVAVDTPPARTLYVTTDDRSITIPADNRVLTVTTETRTLGVTQ